MDAPRVKDVDPVRKAGRERQLVACMATVNPEKAQGTKGEANENENEIDAMAESTKLTPALSGCVYMPPALLRTLKATAEHDRGSAEYRVSLGTLCDSQPPVSSLNKVNMGNIKYVVSEDLIRGRGLSPRRIMKAQAGSLPFTPAFAALVSIISTKLPIMGELSASLEENLRGTTR